MAAAAADPLLALDEADPVAFRVVEDAENEAADRDGSVGVYGARHARSVPQRAMMTATMGASTRDDQSC